VRKVVFSVVTVVVLSLIVLPVLAAQAQQAMPTGAKKAPTNLRIDRVAIDDTSGRTTLAHGVLGVLPAGDTATAAQVFVREDAARVIELGEGSDVEVVRIHSDALGMTHIRMQQTHLGLEVDGADFYLHVDSQGRVVTFNGLIAQDITQTPMPVLQSHEAVHVLRLSLDAPELKVLEQPELVYYASHLRTTRLSWRTVIEYTDDEGWHQDRVYVDTVNGDILGQHGLLQTGLYRKIYDANQTTSVPGALMFEEGGASSDQIAMAAYNNTGIVYSYYDQVFGRDSYNNSGAQIKSSVHCVFSNGSSTTPNNAAWSSYYQQFLFGDGDGSTFGPIAYALDVTGHEFAHAVTSSTADLTYQNESGALNESISDIYGAAIEAWDDGGVSSNTWKIGEDCYTPGTSGDALRYMNDPAADGSSPDYYPERYTGTQDYGGVHINAGIGTLAFYLLSEGGTHPNGKTSVNVPGIGITKAQNIFYRALTSYMTSSTNFEGGRNTTAQAAEDLYGSAEADAVHKAWDAVGVPGGPDPGGEITELTNGEAVSNLSASTGQELHFSLDVPSGASNLEFAISGGTGDADLYVRFGAQPTTSSYDYRPYLNGNNETVTPSSATAGTWYVMVRAYNSFSGLSLVGSFDSGSSNQTPNAGFTYSVNDLTASFTSTSSDPDGSISSHSWSFGDGATSSATNPIHSYSSEGTYTVTLTVTDNGGATDQASQSVTVTEPATGPTELTNGQTVSNLSAAKSEELHYFIDVPSGASNLEVAISSGSGDADLYVRRGNPPTTSEYDYRPYLNGNNETVEVPSPGAGSWYIMVRAYAAFSGVTLVASYDEPSSNEPPTADFTYSTSDLTASFSSTSSDPDGSISSYSWSFGDGAGSTSADPSHTYSSEGGYSVTLVVTDNDGATDQVSKSVTVTAPSGDPSELENGVPVGNLSASTGQSVSYHIEVPSGMSELKISISGGSGDADLYVKHGSAPTTSSYDYRPYLSGNNETVTVSSPAAGTWYIMVRAYSSFSGVTLVAAYEGGSSGGTQTASVDGSVAGKGSKYYNVTVSGGTIDLSLTWDNSMDLDLYLYDSNDNQVASGLTTNKPETLTFNTNGAAGTYKIRVYNYTNQTWNTANFTLTATYEP
jgi:vibriolysin